MKFTALSSLLTLALVAKAAPTGLVERAAPTDKQIIEFALNLEHLEYAF